MRKLARKTGSQEPRAGIKFQLAQDWEKATANSMIVDS
jgi:hypothetical protein